MATNDFTYRYDYINSAKKDYGEFSNYVQKNNVYKQLIKEIKKCNDSFDIETMEWIVDIAPDRKNELFNQEVKLKSELVISKEETKKGTLTEENKEAIRRNIEKKSNNDKASIVNYAIKKEFLESIKGYMIDLMDSSIVTVGDWNNYTLWKNDTSWLKTDFCALSDDLLNSVLKEIYEDDVIKHRHRCAHNLTSYQQNLPVFDTLSAESHIRHNYFYRFAILILIDEIFIRLYREYLAQIEFSPQPYK
ncbi:MAG: hypothetical protein NC405_08265 [Odoribacter sp.]|nr:hypothetical protein [Odoribacter sp.]